MADLPQRVALVYDRVNTWGGAEQVLLALHEIWPAAPLYTAVYNSSTAAWAEVFPSVIPSFLKHWPWASTHHEFYPWLTPLAFESLKFSGYDAVISVTSSDAKGILTPPGTFHLCYCLTPTRYLYSHPVIPWPLSGYLKTWDSVACRRPDAYIAISQTVQARIKTYYGLDSHVVYPPAGITPPSITANNQAKSAPNYFLWVGRLVYHKQPDLLIRLFNHLGLPLTIAGTGRLSGSLQRLAKSNITFAGHVSDTRLQELYRQATAFVSVHEEDFGLAYVEAQAAGLPIIALRRGGVGEIVIDGQTGALASDLDQLIQLLKSFDRAKFDPQVIRASATRFSQSRFRQEFVKVFTTAWTKFKNTSTS